MGLPSWSNARHEFKSFHTKLNTSKKRAAERQPAAALARTRFALLSSKTVSSAMHQLRQGGDHEEDCNGRPGGFDDGRPLVNLERQRLFDIHIAAGVESVDGDGRVPVVGCGDQDNINLLVQVKAMQSSVDCKTFMTTDFQQNALDILGKASK